MTSPMVREIQRDLLRLPATLVRFLAEALRWVVLAPIREGRLRLDHQSAGLRALTTLTILLGGALVALVVTAGWIRSSSELAVVVTGGSVLSVPRSAVWVFVLALCLVVAMLQAAAMHTTLWFRVAVLAVVATMLLFVGSIDSTGGMSAGIWVAVAAILGLVGLEVLRWRRAPQWWEPLVVLAVVTTVFAVVYLRSGDVAQTFGIDRTPLVTGSVIRQFRLLAVPLAIFAGVAVAKVALSGMTFVSDFSVRRFSPTTFTMITLAVLAWRVVWSASESWDEIRHDPATASKRFVGAAAAILVVVGIWWVTHLLLDRADARARRSEDLGPVAARSATTTERIVRRLDDVAMPVSIVLGILVVPTFLAALGSQISSVLFGADAMSTRFLVRVIDGVTTDGVLRATRFVSALALIGCGLWLGRRGRRGVAELTAVVGVWVLIYYLTDSRGPLRGWTSAPEVIDRFGVLTAVVLTLTWARRRTLSIDRLGAVLLMVLVSSLLGERDFVSSPLTVILGTSGIAVVLFGFVWNFLADAQKASIGSPGFPRESRLLLYLSQTLFGLTVLAWVALTRDPTSGLDLSVGSELGDAFLGVPLLIVVYLTVLTGSVRVAAFAPGAVRAESVELPFDEAVEAVETSVDAVVEDLLAPSGPDHLRDDVSPRGKRPPP